MADRDSPTAGMTGAGTAAPRDRIGVAIRAAAAQGRTAIVAFMTAGFPDRDQFQRHHRRAELWVYSIRDSAWRLSLALNLQQLPFGLLPIIRKSSGLAGH